MKCTTIKAWGRRSGQIRRTRAAVSWWLCLVSVLLVLGTSRQEHAARAQQTFEWSYNDWGGIGLIQTRNARFAEDGQLGLLFSHVDPYARFGITLQAFPWLEGTFRYTRSDDPIFGQGTGDDTILDRGADLKFKLWDESKYLPQMALGFQDLLGTGLFSGEYVVASKRWYDLDFSLGLGWGNPGARGNFTNPFTYVADRFKARERQGDQGGTLEFNRYFSGERIGVFGGVEYLTPIDGLRLKLEYDGNGYSEEPLGARLDADSPVNFGLDYAPWPWLSLGVAWERGNELQTRVTVSAKLNEVEGLPKSDPPPPPLIPRPTKPAARGVEPTDTDFAFADVGWESEADEMTARLFDAFESRQLEVEEIAIEGEALRVFVFSEGAELPVSDMLAAAKDTMGSAALPVDRVTIATRVDDEVQDLLTVSARDVFGPAAGAEERDGTSLQTAQAEPAEAGISPGAKGAAAEAVFVGIEAQGFEAEAFDLTTDEATVHITQDKYRDSARAIGRAARVLASVAPPQVERLTVVLMQDGVEANKVTILRKDLENALSFEGSAEEIWANAVFESPGDISAQAARNPDRRPGFDWFLAPRLRQSIGDPNEFYTYQLWAELGAEVELLPGVIFEGSVGANIVNNFDQLQSNPESRLPNVRSRIVDYLQQGENNLVNLVGHYIARPYQEIYTRLTLGYLEEMYAGVSGEVLYRPYGKRWALGLELNQVYQREFEQRFGLLEDDLAYDVFTGHLDLYYRLPWYDLETQVSAGRYLARDVGGTFQIARRFDSGVRMGGWATFTDVSAEEFGEGSFDKGFFITIPLDLFFLSSTRKTARIAFRPLTRDGGQRVNVPRRMYGVTEEADFGLLGKGWPQILN